MISTIWYNGLRGSWDHGMLMEVFDKHPDVFMQYNRKENPVFHDETWDIIDHAIIIIVGCPETNRLRQYLDQFNSGLVILTSEEDSFFDYKAAIPPQFEIWTQYYSECTGGLSIPKNDISTRLLLGAPNRLKDYKINRHLPKKYLWSFVGQVQNQFRQACVDVLRTLPNGFLHVADAFGGEQNGIEYQEYLDIMCQSHFVICPAGSMCVDSFRLYEAMECGAIPITNERAPRDAEGFNYWKAVLGDSFPMTESGSWGCLGEVIKYSKKFIDSGHATIDGINKWYFDYKKQLEQKLLSYAK